MTDALLVDAIKAKMAMLTLKLGNWVKVLLLTNSNQKMLQVETGTSFLPMIFGLSLTY